MFSIYRVTNGVATLVGANNPNLQLPYGVPAARYKIKVIKLSDRIRFECDRSNLVRFDPLDTTNINDINSCVMEDTVAAAVSKFGDGGKIGFYALTGSNGDNRSWYDNVTVNSIVYDTENPPAVPQNLIATAVSTSRINLGWIDASTNETGFKVERSVDNKNFIELASLGPNTTAYYNIGAGIAADKTYYYRVKAYNSKGNSGYSNTANATTLPLGEATKLKGWELNQTNTGLGQFGLDYTMLDDYTGSYNPPSGTYIYRKHITTTLDLSAGNITIEQCSIRPEAVGVGMPLVENSNNNSPVYIIDSDIDGTGIADPNVVAYSFGFGGCGMIERCRIFGMGSGLNMGGNVSLLIEGNYIYGLRAGNNLAMSSGSHNDGFTTRAYVGPGMIVRNNRIDCSSGHDTGALFLQPTFGPLNNILVEGNLLEGLGGHLILEDKDYPYGTNISAVNNRFAPPGVGYMDSGGPGWFHWLDNYMNDPSQPDNKGAWVPEMRPTVNNQIAAPSNLQALAVSNNQINLTWVDNSNNETRFRIERCSVDNIFSAVAMIGPGLTSYSDTGLTGNTIYYYRVSAFNRGGNSVFFDTANAKTFTNTVASSSAVPKEFAVSQNYPNPFNPTTKIDFFVATKENIKLVIYDVLGRQIRILVDGMVATGTQSVFWDGRDTQGKTVSSGVYFYSVEHRGQRIAKRMVLIK
jgi:hypothetical protein